VVWQNINIVWQCVTGGDTMAALGMMAEAANARLLQEVRPSSLALH
jgi:hypothetical protein